MYRRRSKWRLRFGLRAKKGKEGMKVTRSENDKCAVSVSVRAYSAVCLLRLFQIFLCGQAKERGIADGRPFLFTMRYRKISGDVTEIRKSFRLQSDD